MSLLRDRMSRDMERAGLALRTRKEYIAAIRHMAEFFRKSPEVLNPDDIRAWDDEMDRRGRGPDWKAVHVAALLFLYRRTMARPEMVSFLAFPRRPRRLPVILSPAETGRLLASLREPRYRIFYTLLYDTGLRISEAAQLRAEDIDRERGVLHVRHGKGGKERQVNLGDRLYEHLRAYWREVRQKGPGAARLTRESLVFVSGTGGPLNFASVRKALALATREADIAKRVTPHSLRHAYATAQLEAGMDLRALQVQMGHSSLRTTQIYLHVSTRLIRQSPSPLDALPPPP
jgi:integrase/recombinase XerD